MGERRTNSNTDGSTWSKHNSSCQTSCINNYALQYSSCEGMYNVDVYPCTNVMPCINAYVHVQWNLWIRHIRGGLLSSVERLSLSQRLLASQTPQLWGCKFTMYTEECGLQEAESAILCRYSEWTKVDRTKCFLGTAELLNAEIFILISIIFTATYCLGHTFCPLSGDRWLSVARRLKMH